MAPLLTLPYGAEAGLDALNASVSVKPYVQSIDQCMDGTKFHRMCRVLRTSAAHEI